MNCFSTFRIKIIAFIFKEFSLNNNNLFKWLLIKPCSTEQAERVAGLITLSIYFIHKRFSAHIKYYMTYESFHLFMDFILLFFFLKFAFQESLYFELLL